MSRALVAAIAIALVAAAPLAVADDGPPERPCDPACMPDEVEALFSELGLGPPGSDPCRPTC